jgi:phosphomevalonate kinase
VKASAPGKLLLSGAYSVLEGAEAIVTAVDRYVICDSERPAERVAPEVLAALGPCPAPHFDAAALRAEGRKLGLGSSAAILVASLAAIHEHLGDPDALRRSIESVAVSAHRRAQGGGSGVDVLASVWGGTSIVRRNSETSLLRRSVPLPVSLVVEAWAAGVSASTPLLLGRVAAFREREPTRHAHVMTELRASATRAARALSAAQSDGIITELNVQRQWLSALGAGAEIPIVTDEVQALASSPSSAHAAVLPSGAGGGDIVLWVSSAPSPPEFRSLAARLGHALVPLELGARGVEQHPTERSSQRGA